eukprot:4613635-Prymnesium_polylepis.1
MTQAITNYYTKVPQAVTPACYAAGRHLEQRLRRRTDGRVRLTLAWDPRLALSRDQPACCAALAPLWLPTPKMRDVVSSNVNK